MSFVFVESLPGGGSAVEHAGISSACAHSQISKHTFPHKSVLTVLRTELHVLNVTAHHCCYGSYVDKLFHRLNIPFPEVYTGSNMTKHRFVSLWASLKPVICSSGVPIEFSAFLRHNYKVRD